MAVRGNPQDSDNPAAQGVAARTEINGRFEPHTGAELVRTGTRGSVRTIGSAEAVSEGPQTLACASTRSVALGFLRRFELARSRGCDGRLDRQCPSTL